MLLCVCTCVWLCVCMYMHVCMYVRACVCMYTSTCICMYMHVRACFQLFSSSEHVVLKVSYFDWPAGRCPSSVKN